jgi:RHS repeat-associated protein
MSVKDPSGVTTSMNYNFSFGLLSTVTDPNNLTTSMQYDALGRKSKQTNPDGTSISWTYATCPAGLPAACEVSINATTNDVSGNYIRDVQSYSDAVGRTFATFSRNQNPGSGGHTYTASGVQYDVLGRVAARDIPVPAFNGAVAPQITYHYDLLNRVMQKQRPISASNSTLQTTQYTYSGRTTTITDANGHNGTLIEDVNGWLRQTKDASASGYTIILGYDAAGSETSVSDSAGNTLSSAQYAYGIAPFTTQSTDTDLGTWTYSYDAFGDTIGWTDAKNQSVTVTYDALSRPVNRKEFDLFTQWTWGTSATAHEIGQLHSVCTGVTAANPTQCDANSYAESEAYDGAGRLAGRAIVIPGDGTYSYSWAYNATTGLLDTMTYPADLTTGFQLKLQYGYTNGLTSSIKDVIDNVTLWSLGNPSSQVAVDGQGHYLQENLGNGLVVNSNFDAVTGWLNGMTAGPAGGTALQSASYLFDKVGNLTQRQDNVAGTSESIFPDALNRLDHSVGTGGATSSQLTYDSIGRLATWGANGSTANVNDYTTPQPGCTYYANAQLHALRQSSQGSNTQSFCYDANGNMVSGGGAPITWTSYNQPSLISVPLQGSVGFGGQRSYSYDHNHQRWREEVIDSTGTTISDYIGGLFEKVALFSGTTSYRNYIPAGNNLIVYNHSSAGNTISYITRDTLGSTSLVTNQTGAAVVQARFADFGWNLGTQDQQTTLAGITELGFTGQEQMHDVGMVNMNGRVYDFSGSYFLSPDPALPHPTDTRSYNRYAYARYNPLTYVDPTGFDDGSCYQDVPMQDGGEYEESAIPLPGCVENITITTCAPWNPLCGDNAQQYYCQVVAPLACAPQPGQSAQDTSGGGGSSPPQANQQQQQKPQGNQPNNPCPGAGGNPLAFRGANPVDLNQNFTPVPASAPLPAGAFSVIAPDGMPFYAPANADFVAVYQYGQTIYNEGLASGPIPNGMEAAFYFGGYFDFQRLKGNLYNGRFSYAANYGIGVGFAGAQLSLTEALTFAFLIKNGLAGGKGAKDSFDAIRQGYAAAISGACSR